METIIDFLRFGLIFGVLATAPIVTVVATPEPDGPPSRNEDSTTVRPALLALLPIIAIEKSMKNFPAPECCRNAP